MSEAKNASVLFHRQSVDRLRAAQLLEARKKHPCSCLIGCFQGLLSSFSADSELADNGRSKPPKLEDLAQALPWEQLSEHDRGGVVVASCSSSKSVDGWTNQDSAVACVPVCKKVTQDPDTAAMYGDMYGEQGGDAEAETAEAPVDVRHALFGVLDGHGQHGHRVSQLAASRIPGHLAAQSNFRKDPSKALAVAVKKADADVYSDMASDVEYNGSTVALICLDTKQRVLHCANVGDSRAVLGRQHGDSWEAVVLTRDINPDLPEEKERIERSGGVVSPARIQGELVGPQRVWEDWSLIKPGLAMGRSIGDGCARRVGIIPDPDLSKHNLGPNDRFALIASDGLWDAVSNEEAVSVAGGHLDKPETALTVLTDMVRQRQDGELEDDTTIVMIVFKA